MLVLLTLLLVLGILLRVLKYIDGPGLVKLQREE